MTTREIFPQSMGDKATLRELARELGYNEDECDYALTGLTGVTFRKSLIDRGFSYEHSPIGFIFKRNLRIFTALTDHFREVFSQV